ncbi:ATPase (AAA+ superfamily)-like protein [Paludibacter propionicigenes WB4]|uniref:ATPase (AAA+ superfamily)-like protein n=1 Tax=Paludibacter propionicigenes (strain DSM 17365 / JCM 13257 / WB4) TaxID=694427 RepID=E4T2H3_PALPW|nr:ATP-binding protein [Paludibacter propionicigenes]ADQ78917.1 ATPase (AAA+ superfamily)-like protein [Paludibacter propionicigenes WB4]
MWVDREIKTELVDLALHYPVVMITGPRQAGKTSLARQVFPDKPYYSFENPDVRQQILSDPRAFFTANPDGAIIDEFQRYPEILSYIQGIVDEKKQNGQFILTGSNNVSMLSKVTQSLAGRVALLKLLPFSIAELDAFGKNYSVNDYLLNGFYPRVYADNLNPTKAYRNYYETYVERDIRQILQVKDVSLFQKFMKLCAGRVGQLFNANNLATEVGVSSMTIQAWLSALQATYIVFLVQPWSANISKRLVKTPKLYFYDVGLAAYLLGIENTSHVETHPLRGSLFENMVTLELLKKRYNSGLDNNLYFYRDNHGNEVDIMQEAGYQLNLFEIKSAETFTPHFLKGLDYLKKIVPDRVGKSNLVYAGSDEMTIKEHRIVNYKNLFS